MEQGEAVDTEKNSVDHAWYTNGFSVTTDALEVDCAIEKVEEGESI